MCVRACMCVRTEHAGTRVAHQTDLPPKGEREGEQNKKGGRESKAWL